MERRNCSNTSIILFIVGWSRIIASHGFSDLNISNGTIAANMPAAPSVRGLHVTCNDHQLQRQTNFILLIRDQMNLKPDLHFDKINLHFDVVIKSYIAIKNCVYKL